MEIISEDQAAEILAMYQLRLGDWRQVVSPSRLSASIMPLNDYRTILLAGELAMEWLGAEDWMLCCFDYSNCALEGESEVVTEAAGTRISVVGDQPLLFDRNDIEASATGLKMFAAALVGLEWHGYLVTKGRHGIRCIGLLDGVVDFIHGDQASADVLVSRIQKYRDGSPVLL
ncbi:MAG TPA: hypothetical protein VGC74_01745 [Stenotrophomonas sp.]|jgi:hypothetical protein